MQNNSKLKTFNAFSFIDVLVGIALLLIIFLGILAAYELGLKVVGQSKNRIVATAIANQQIEQIRNLPYDSVGITGGYPDGALEAVTTVFRNNIEYTIEARVDYVIDSADGIALPEDDCPNDYKKAEIKVSWLGRFIGEVEFSTDISPKNLIEECATSGGILSVSVFDAYGIMVSSPLIEVKDPLTDDILKTVVPDNGEHYFSLAADTYKVVVSKNGYSTDRTYGTDEITTPEKPHSIVLEGQLTEVSFSIDKTSSFSIDTLSPWGTDIFSDSFLDKSKIFELSDLTVSGGAVNFTSPSLDGVGYLVSTIVAPANLVNWNKFSWTDSEPSETQINYQALYLNGENWIEIPDADLPGNSFGFSTSPIDLSGLNIISYSQLRLKGNFSTTNLSISPFLYDWQVSWINSESTPIPNADFNLQGDKIIGTDADENSVYKYSWEHISDSGGHIDISDLEWDSYTFSIDPATNLDLIDIDPFPQPISLLPDTSLFPVVLYLEAENSLWVTVQNSETLEPIFTATVRLYNTGLGYDATQYTNESGQTYFIPLDTASDYVLEVQAAGYLDNTVIGIAVSGDITKTVLLQQIE